MTWNQVREAERTYLEFGMAGEPVMTSRPGAGAPGGVKVGAAFFGWLTATGTAVLLTALAAAIFGAIIVDSETEGMPAIPSAHAPAGSAPSGTS